MTKKILEFDASTIEDSAIRSLIEGAQEAIQKSGDSLKEKDDKLAEMGRIKKELDDIRVKQKEQEDQKKQEEGKVQELLDEANVKIKELEEEKSANSDKYTKLEEENAKFLDGIKTSNEKKLETLKEKMPEEAFTILENKVKDLDPRQTQQEIAFASTLLKDGVVVKQPGGGGKGDEKSLKERLQEAREARRAEKEK